MKKFKFIIVKTNDIFRFSGFGLIIWGQFLEKDVPFKIAGFSGMTNVITITGIFIAALSPFVMRYLQSRRK